MHTQFTKMQGTGNDMIIINNLSDEIALSQEQVAHLCDRRFGIGADGLILLEKPSSNSATSEPADCFMNYYNSDGSIGEICGNGIRCLAAFYQKTAAAEEQKTTLHIETRAGIKEIKCADNMYEVEMGPASFESPDFPSESLELEGHTLHFASMGNPHAVALVDDVEAIDLAKIGPTIENHELFPNKINFEIFQKISPTHLKMRVWERGSGITLACGTGACAVYSVAKKLNLVEGEVRLELPGGDLLISQSETGTILMKGPAEETFSGSIEI